MDPNASTFTYTNEDVKELLWQRWLLERRVAQLEAEKAALAPLPEPAGGH